MNQAAITNDTELHLRIMHLTSLKEEQELAIKRNAREMVYSLHPSMIFKNMVKNFSDDEESTESLKNIGLNFGKDFLLSKLFGKGVTLKRFVSSLLMKKAVDYVVNNHSDLIVKGLNKLEDYMSEGKSKSYN